MAIDTADGQNQPPVIRGTLREKGKPISEAAVFLQSLDNEHCAKVFAGSKNDRKSGEEVDRCVHDVGTAYPNDLGQYRFVELKAGWYAVHFLWTIDEKPRSAFSLFKQGGWAVIYDSGKDTSGKYDAMAQDVPFYYSNQDDAVRDFDTRR
jgi:hypothetical protein